MLKNLQQQQNLDLIEGAVEGLIIQDNIIEGVSLADDTKYFAKSVVLTVGTFLNGVMFTGYKTSIGGRVNDVSCVGVTAYLKKRG